MAATAVWVLNGTFGTTFVFRWAGVAVGAGWQSIVTYVNIACYYLVGVPVGVVLGYVFDFQVKVIHFIRCFPAYYDYREGYDSYEFKPRKPRTPKQWIQY